LHILAGLHMTLVASHDPACNLNGAVRFQFRPFDAADNPNIARGTDSKARQHIAPNDDGTDKIDVADVVVYIAVDLIDGEHIDLIPFGPGNHAVNRGVHRSLFRIQYDILAYLEARRLAVLPIEHFASHRFAGLTVRRRDLLGNELALSDIP